MEKILLISHSGRYGGAETVFLNVINCLKEKKKIIVCLPNIKDKLYFKIKEINPNIEVIKLKNFTIFGSFFKIFLKFFIRDWFFTKDFIKYIYIIRKNNVSTIYTSSITCISGVILSILLKKNHIWHIHEMPNKDMQWFDKRIDFIIRYFFRKSKIIFISEKMKNKWLNRLNLGENEIEFEIIYNPIKEIKRINEKKRTKIVIGFAGSCDKNKNVELLLEGFIILKKKYNEIFLKIVGFNMKKNTEKLIGNRLNKNEYQAENFIEINQFYSEIDILVLPSFSEAWPLVALEAMSLGKIVVVTKECSLNELFVDGINLFYIDPNKINSLVNTLDLIINNHEEIKQRLKIVNEKILNSINFNKQFDLKINKILN